MSSLFYYLKFDRENSYYKSYDPIMILWFYNKKLRFMRKIIEEVTVEVIIENGIFKLIDPIKIPEIVLETKEDWNEFIKKEIELGGSILQYDLKSFNTPKVEFSELQKKINNCKNQK